MQKLSAGQRTWGIRWDHNYHARVVRDRFDWGDTPQSKKELCDLIIYELHVRDFTHHPSSGVRHRGTFSGLMEKIPYLKELGINAVELMPIFEFDETMNSRTIDGKQLLECWGYNTVGFFAPNSSYAAANEHNQEGTEFKTLIRELHANGISHSGRCIQPYRGGQRKGQNHQLQGTGQQHLLHAHPRRKLLQFQWLWQHSEL